MSPNIRHNFWKWRVGKGNQTTVSSSRTALINTTGILATALVHCAIFQQCLSLMKEEKHQYVTVYLICTTFYKQLFVCLLGCSSANSLLAWTTGKLFCFGVTVNAGQSERNCMWKAARTWRKWLVPEITTPLSKQDTTDSFFFWNTCI